MAFYNSHKIGVGDASYIRAMSMNNLAQPLRRMSSAQGGAWKSFQRLRRYAFCHKANGHALSAGDVRSVARRSRLEAILFLAREPLGIRKLAQLANLADGTEARTLLRGLQQRYDERGCAFQVAQVAGGYQLLSRRELAAWLRPQASVEREIRLSPPALETLAVVAYRQPVLRAEVEAIRGVACGEILRQLLDRDLLRIVGRSEELGRPLRYGTTKRFLEVYGLSNLDQLPWSDQLRRCPESDESNSDSSASKTVVASGLTADGEAE